MNSKRSNNLDWEPYSLLALIIIFPLLTLGYVQTLDMPWGPYLSVAPLSDNYWLLTAVIKGFSVVLSSMLVQKLLLLGIFVLAGVGMHRFVLLLSKFGSSAAFVAGVLYVVNPFVYTRLMAGQWLVLLGYALVPWAVASLWRLMRQPGLRTALVAVAWTAAVGLTSIHAVGFVALAAVVLLVAAGRKDSARRLQWLAAVAVAWVVVNGLWLVPLLLGRSGNATQIESFGASQLTAFASSGSVLGSVPLSTLLLQGFWADPQGRYYLPSHLGWWWGIVVVLLGALIVAGAVRVVRGRDRLGIGLLVLAAIAWWLGMGVGSSWSSGTTNFLVHYLPFYQGYREPQKWLMLLALAYAYMAAVGTAWLGEWLRQHKPELRPAVIYVGLLPLLATPVLLWGAAGQLHSRQYPADWAQTAAILDKDETDYKVLVLPWHVYLPVSFVGRVVANPAPQYFNKNLIISDNLELAGVPPQQGSALYKQLDNYTLPQAKYRSDVAQQLAPYKVKYVMLLHEADWQRYDWLGKQTGLQPLQRSQHISLYRNTEVR